jgi:TPP-dependent pyruvate/acetoin dehydrogenase alpha subunit
MTEPRDRLSHEQLEAFLGEMLLIRRFEEKVEERFRAGDLPGFLHADIGQEATRSARLIERTGMCWHTGPRRAR